MDADDEQILRPDKWVDRYAESLHRFALDRVNDEQQAQDLVQETFLAALEQLDRFNYKSSEKTWLTGILKFKIFRVYRNRSKRPIQLIDFNDPLKQDEIGTGYQSGACYSPEKYEPFHDKEFVLVLRHALHQLPELWQTVFELQYIEGMETSYICARLNISQSYYWVICYRTKQAIKQYFLANWL